MAALFARRGRCALVAAVLALVVTAGGCGSDGFSLPEWDAPGQNARIGDIMIRYAHVAEPRSEPWQPGDDIPAYVWIYNKGKEADRLVGASTPNAASVDIVDSNGKPLADGVALPANKLVELEPSESYLVLRDVREVIRGGDFMKFTMRFEKAGSITFNIQSQIPAYDESPSPTY
ncbi:copper chaperone PCu(A)C [Streptomyces tirandamycinicus]|uniref:copper chaperone PCu(A)C n=1 Tax=Streptomyces tirandamycinicus TaxID=2174846 RepID=UPI00226E5373|nr:copper chaperone PCu(A)C [Streptomyces tirandamycinicus]MCY0979516.1 copper chaperone PCu(A)C [Streptomyces tirandamycinicus]